MIRLFLPLLLFSTPAQAEPEALYIPMSCNARPAAAEVLEQLHGERRIGWGATLGGNIAELFVRPDGNSWTLLVTFPDGTACVFQAGEYWEKTTPGMPR